MGTVAQKKSRGQGHQWWFIQHLIAGLDTTPTIKYLLTLVYLHTNKDRGFAWTSQKTLAREMCVDESTVKRTFRKAKKMGVVISRTVRTSRLPKDQHNEYWLDIERMKALQRGDYSPETANTDDTDQQGAPVPLDAEPNKGQISLEQGANGTRTGGTSAPEGFDLKQVASNSGEKDDDDDKRARQNRARVDSAPGPPPQEKTDPFLKAWAESRILRSANETDVEIKARRAYVHKALPDFLNNLTSEVIAYLSEEAENFLEARFQKNPKEIVRFTEIGRMFKTLVDRYHLPCNDEMAASAVRACHQRRGWTEHSPHLSKYPT